MWWTCQLSVLKSQTWRLPLLRQIVFIIPICSSQTNHKNHEEQQSHDKPSRDGVGTSWLPIPQIQLKAMKYWLKCYLNYNKSIFVWCKTTWTMRDSSCSTDACSLGCTVALIICLFITLYLCRALWCSWSTPFSWRSQRSYRKTTQGSHDGRKMWIFFFTRYSQNNIYHLNKRLTLYDCSKSKNRLSFSTTSSSSRLPWGHVQNNIYFCHLAHYSRAGGGMGGGSPAEQLCPTAQRTPQTDSSETDAEPPRCSETRPRVEERNHPSPKRCGGKNKNLANGCSSCRRHRHRSRMLQIWETLTRFLWATIVPSHTWAPCQTSEGLRRSPWSALPFSLLCPAACWSCCGYF